MASLKAKIENIESNFKISPLGYPMLDGSHFGISMACEDKSENNEEDFALSLAMNGFKVGDNGKDSQWVYVNEGHSNLRMMVTKGKGKDFLNIKGNLISHATGQNMVGPRLNLKRMILSTMKRLKKDLKKKNVVLPDSILRKVRKGDVYLHELSFATYSKKLVGSIENFACFLVHVLNYKNLNITRTIVDDVGRELEQSYSLADLKDLKVFLDGFGTIRVMRMVSTNIYWVLSFYPKDVERLTKGFDCITEFKNSFRLDVRLSNQFLKKREIQTLKQFEEKMVTEKGSQEAWVQHFMESLMGYLDLDYIINSPSFDSLKMGKYEKEFKAWLNGEEISKTARRFFAKQGLKTELGVNWHLLAEGALASYVIPKSLLQAVKFRNPKTNIEAWVKKLSDIEIFKKDIENLWPREGAYDYSMKDDNVVSTKTGDVTSVKEQIQLRILSMKKKDFPSL